MRKLRNLKSATFSLLFVLFLSLSFLGNYQISHAGWLCDGIGTPGMIPKQVPINTQNAKLQDIGNRRYTILELFNHNASSFGIPMGHNEEHWLIYAGNNKVGDKVSLTTEQENLLKAHGQRSGCIFFHVAPDIQNEMQAISSALSNIIKGLITTFFDSKFICDDPNNPTDGCVNLLKVVGGTSNEDGGLVGTFSKGFFMPLATLAFLTTAGWLVYTGLIKRQFRASFGGLAWGIAAFALGILLMQKPFLLSRAPHIVNTTVSTCIIDAINGESCLDNSGTGSTEVFTDTACLSTTTSPLDVNDNMQLKLNGLSCSITKGLTVDRWAEQQFGYSFNELYTKDAPNGYEVYPSDKIQGSPDDYCVNMYSSSSPKELTESSNPQFTDSGEHGQICNIALAYMANRTVGDFGNNAEMEHIIATATLDPRMWSAFTGNGRDTIGLFSLLSILFVAITFVPIVLYGHAYALSATLLMIFAPMFLLLAIHPGNGRKIFLGWLESVISSCLKFMASGLLVMVSLLVFSSIISQLNGFMAFLSSLILCFTFISYRKELVNLVGATNMGGKALSNKFEDKYKKAKDKTLHTGTAIAGGAIGGAIAGKGEEGILKGAYKGASRGLSMELKRGRGFVASAVRQGTQVSQEFAKERQETKKRVIEEANRQEVFSRMDAQTSKISGMLAKNATSEMKHYSEEKIDDQVKISTSLPIIQQLNETRDAVSNAKSRDAIKVQSEKADKQIAEASSIERHIQNNSGDAKLGMKDYISEYKIMNEERILSKASELEKDPKFSGTSAIEKTKIINGYISNELEYLNKHIKDIEGQFSVFQDKETGKTHLTEVNLEQIYNIKQEYSANSAEKYKNILTENPTKKDIIEEVNKVSSSEKGLPPIEDIE